MHFFLSNSTAQTPTSATLACFSNEFSLGLADDGRPDEWLCIPYGDHPHSHGVVQRLSRQSADVMVSNFKSVASRLGRFFGGDPIYIGHPDDPTLANQFTDKKAYGWIKDMEARADGLYIKPDWSKAGLELLANAHFKWFSPCWGCKIIPGARAGGLPVAEPIKWKSLGLTNNPNIQGILPLANETQQNTQGVTAMRDQLITLLGLAPDATDEQIVAAVNQLKSANSTAETAVANERTAKTSAEDLAHKAHVALDQEITARKTAETMLANERRARIDLILANAVAAGKITEAQKPLWAAGLEQSFDAKLLELSNTEPVINTKSRTDGLGARNSAAQTNRDAQTRRDQVLMLVNERMDKSGEDYTTAFAAVQRANPALFENMQTPTK